MHFHWPSACPSCFKLVWFRSFPVNLTVISRRRPNFGKRWLLDERQKHLPSSGMMKAIDYGLGRWKELTAFIKHLPLPLTNNDAERALRHSVLGRKNFAGSKSIDGADTAATLYTIVESCKKASIQPRNYLKYVIEERWHNRQPLSPLRYSWMKNGKPARVGQ